MIDLTPTVTNAQIAAFLGIIAVAVVYAVFVKKPTPTSKKK